jgi:hypothetical protein
MKISYPDCRLLRKLLTLCKRPFGMTTVIINDHTAKGKSLLQFLKKFEGENFIYIGDEQK